MLALATSMFLHFDGFSVTSLFGKIKRFLTTVYNSKFNVLTCKVQLIVMRIVRGTGFTEEGGKIVNIHTEE